PTPRERSCQAPRANSHQRHLGFLHPCPPSLRQQEDQEFSLPCCPLRRVLLTPARPTKALGNFGVPEIIPVVQKALDEQSEPIIKVKAIYALQNLIQSRGNLNQQGQQQQGQQQQEQQQQGQQQQPISADRQSYEVVTDKLVE
ncbi:unnamed protein product, partial [Allacma fusca]